MINRGMIVDTFYLCKVQDLCRTDCPYWNENDLVRGCMERLADDVYSLLKEQEEREKRICKKICDIIRDGCSTDTDDDKDFVCHEIQKCFMEGSETE